LKCMSLKKGWLAKSAGVIRGTQESCCDLATRAAQLILP
jgi:hypothetical protein